MLIPVKLQDRKGVLTVHALPSKCNSNPLLLAREEQKEWIQNDCSTDREMAVLWGDFPIVTPCIHVWRCHVVLHKYATIAVL